MGQLTTKFYFETWMTLSYKKVRFRNLLISIFMNFFVIRIEFLAQILRSLANTKPQRGRRMYFIFHAIVSRELENMVFNTGHCLVERNRLCTASEAAGR